MPERRKRPVRIKTTTDIPVELHDRLTRLAVHDYESIAHELRRAIQEYLARREREDPGSSF